MELTDCPGRELSIERSMRVTSSTASDHVLELDRGGRADDAFE
jgi:hypothetical protein